MEALRIKEHFQFGGTRFYESDKVLIVSKDEIYLIAGEVVTELIPSNCLENEIRNKSTIIGIG